MSKTVRPRRSVLYMPGANTRALEKARTLPADALIFDLEDAVAPDAKEAARTNVVLAAQSKAYGKREIVIRCNVSVHHRTGVEMEALTGATIAALTVYDMCKALSHDIEIGAVRLTRKTGGKRDFKRKTAARTTHK